MPCSHVTTLARYLPVLAPALSAASAALPPRQQDARGADRSRRDRPVSVGALRPNARSSVAKPRPGTRFPQSLPAPRAKRPPPARAPLAPRLAQPVVQTPPQSLVENARATDRSRRP